VRRTILTASPLMVAGAVMSALAGQLRLAGGRPDPDRHRLRAGLPGCTHRAALSAGALHHGLPASSWRWAAGMLATGTPLAWLIEASSWRMGFWVLALCAALVLGAIALWMREPPPPAAALRESLHDAAHLRRAVPLPHTLGIVALALVTYASFVALRGCGWGR
jgi:hypothetical protein